MAKITPFFHRRPHMTGAMSPVPEPERYPFHDDDACPVGQQVKRSGQWQYYEPRVVEETRIRCSICQDLG